MPARFSPAHRIALVAALLLAAVAVAAIGATRGGGVSRARAGVCPPGTTTRAQRDRMHEREVRFERVHAAGTGENERKVQHEEASGERAGIDGCVPLKHPESTTDIAAVNAFRAVRSSAPFSTVAPGAYASAVSQRNALAAKKPTTAGTGGSWVPAGKGPLIADDARYPEVNGLGLADLNGRVTDYSYDKAADRVYASVGEGGVWVSDDQGAHWRSIGDGLPTQAVGSVAFAPAKGNRPATVIALTGDDVFGGGSTYSGLGVYRTTDGGKTWTKSKGVPDAALGFRLKVDPANADIVYAATGKGLYRSTDGGASFTNVKLPTGFGWRAGNKTNVGGFVESAANGIYTSADGAGPPSTRSRSPSTGAP